MARRERPRLRYSEGDVFVVPLRDGDVGRVVVARKGRGVAFGYFFGPRLAVVEDARVDDELVAGRAVLVGMFGDLHVIDGTWPRIGRVDPWTRASWPLPPLGRVADGWGILTYYDDSLRTIRQERRAAAEVAAFPYDRCMGAGAAEIRLTRHLPRSGAAR